jgi:hypothetical protein
MRQHAFVTWVEMGTPWELEKQLLSSGICLPLNLHGNPRLEAIAIVIEVRLKARKAADRLAIVVDEGGPRRPSRLAKP